MQISDLFALRQFALRLFTPLERACASPDAAAALLAELGYVAPTTVTAFQRLTPTINALDELFKIIDELHDDAGSPEVAEAALRALKSLNVIINGINGITSEVEKDFAGLPILTETDIVAQLSRKLSDYLISRLLESYYPTLSASLNLMGLIEMETITVSSSEFRFIKRTIHWSRLPELVKNPIQMLVANLTSEDEVLVYRALYFVNQLGVSLGLPSGFRSPEENLLGVFNGGADLFAREDSDQLITLRFPVTIDPDIDAGFDLYPLVDTNTGKHTGIALAIRTGAQLDIPLSDAYLLQIKASANARDGLGLRLPRNDNITFISNLFNSPSELGANTTFELRFSIKPTEAATSDKFFTFGSPDGTSLEIGSGSLSLGVEKSAALDLFVEADLKDIVVSFKTDEADGFISSLLPKEGLATPFNLAVGLSKNRGLYFSGAAALSMRIPIHAHLGPVELQYVGLEVRALDDSLPIDVTTGIAATLGPLSVVVEDIGLHTVVKVNPDRNGNLGPIDLSSSFKPPKGVGLAIAAPIVEGGGFLQFDPQQGQYSGFLELKIAERISVKGFGLLNTRLPGGGKGFSLVILIFVEGFKPIPLGLGFNLAGIGGLVALNRTFDENALRTGLKQHTLDSVLFPQDPIRNAPQIISNLNRVFPPATGHHLFGPMVQITWGTPALITAEVAVVLELGARRRLLLLAQVLSVLPRPEHDLVHLQMDAIGVVDFDQGTAALDATLYDSRLLQKFPLTGDMAMRLSWESSPNFALAVGGLHPAFNPPPNFPKLERIAINLSAGDNPRLRCEAYFALTANTVQFGARAELFASAAGFSVHGDIGFDVLIQFDPFYFIADFHAQLQLKRGSTNLFKVELKGSLEGPRPLHIKGKATFSIFWWDISIRIDKTLISGEKPPLPAPVAVLPRLQEALGQPGNWTARLPAGANGLVQLRPNAGAATDIRLHPLGTLTVKQGVVPLNTDISRFGQAAPAGARRFAITSVNLGGQDQKQTTVPIKDFFAPAQFIELTDDQKLSRPSFESMEAGVSFGTDALSFTTNTNDWLEVKTIEFETWILDSETGEARRSEAEKPKPQQPALFYQLNHTLLLQQARFGAAGSSELRRTGKAKYRATTINKYQVTKEGWSVVAADDLTKQPLRTPESYTEAVESLRKLQQQDAKAASLTIVRLSEIKS